MAFSEDGIARAGMGVDAADYDRSGRPGIIISNFSNQMLSLYHNEGNGLFVDEAPRSSVGRASLLTLGFACLFFDYDLDGWPDIFVANGHLDSDIEQIQKRIRYRQPPHLFRNLGGGKFTEVTASAGPAFSAPRVARGSAYADIDNDGDLDLLVTTNGGPALLFRNEGGNRNHALRVKLQGTTSNRDGIGAVVRIEYDGEKQWQMLRSGSSYLSQSELVLTFGLGQRTNVASVQVEWPSGNVDRFTNVAADQTITVKEEASIILAKKFSKYSPVAAAGGSDSLLSPRAADDEAFRPASALLYCVPVHPGERSAAAFRLSSAQAPLPERRRVRSCASEQSGHGLHEPAAFGRALRCFARPGPSIPGLHPKSMRPSLLLSCKIYRAASAILEAAIRADR